MDFNLFTFGDDQPDELGNEPMREPLTERSIFFYSWRFGRDGDYPCDASLRYNLLLHDSILSGDVKGVESALLEGADANCRFSDMKATMLRDPGIRAWKESGGGMWKKCVVKRLCKYYIPRASPLAMVGHGLQLNRKDVNGGKLFFPDQAWVDHGEASELYDQFPEQTKDVDMAKLLIAKGADVSGGRPNSVPTGVAVSTETETPLEAACAEGKFHLASLLLAEGADLSESSAVKIIRDVAEMGHLDKWERILHLIISTVVSLHKSSTTNNILGATQPMRPPLFPWGNNFAKKTVGCFAAYGQIDFVELLVSTFKLDVLQRYAGPGEQDQNQPRAILIRCFQNPRDIIRLMYLGAKYSPDEHQDLAQLAGDAQNVHTSDVNKALNTHLTEARTTLGVDGSTWVDSIQPRLEEAMMRGRANDSSTKKSSSSAHKNSDEENPFSGLLRSTSADWRKKIFGVHKKKFQEQTASFFVRILDDVDWMSDERWKSVRADVPQAEGKPLSEVKESVLRAVRGLCAGTSHSGGELCAVRVFMSSGRTAINIVYFRLILARVEDAIAASAGERGASHSSRESDMMTSELLLGGSISSKRNRADHDVVTTSGGSGSSKKRKIAASKASPASSTTTTPAKSTSKAKAPAPASAKGGKKSMKASSSSVPPRQAKESSFLDTYIEDIVVPIARALLKGANEYSWGSAACFPGRVANMLSLLEGRVNLEANPTNSKSKSKRIAGAEEEGGERREDQEAERALQELLENEGANHGQQLERLENLMMRKHDSGQAVEEVRAEAKARLLEWIKVHEPKNSAGASGSNSTAAAGAVVPDDAKEISCQVSSSGFFHHDLSTELPGMVLSAPSNRGGGGSSAALEDFYHSGRLASRPRDQLGQVFEMMVDGTDHDFAVNELRGIFARTLMDEKFGEFARLWNRKLGYWMVNGVVPRARQDYLDRCSKLADIFCESATGGQGGGGIIEFLRGIVEVGY